MRFKYSGFWYQPINFPLHVIALLLCMLQHCVKLLTLATSDGEYEEYGVPQG